MTELNDSNTRSSVRHGRYQLVRLLDHFNRNGEPTWQQHLGEEVFTTDDANMYLETLKVNLITLTHCVEAELQARYAVEPQELGT
jgi:hypothetical protein